MSIISYAQNFEDVMLWRALKHIQKGFYIDVGAWSPDIDSVTRLFYENNWRGINVEPNPEFHAQYGTKRPEDVNLKVAVGDREGVVFINFMSNPGLSTAVEQFAKQHESAGWTIDKQEVSLTTLASICKQHIEENKDIHFLKVDVEGLEEAALRGNDWSTYRPWIVVVEATLPMTQIESYQEWESILVNAGYAFAYADGLNRFYVANEHAELLDSFKYPPNVFDGFLLNSQQEAEAKAQQAEAKAQQAEAKAQQAEAKAQQAEVKAQQAEVKAQQAEVKAQQAEAKAQQAEVKAQQSIDQAQQAQSQAQTIADQLESIYSSRSWRLTAPLRQLVNFLRSFKQP
jgi:FkbM family methyltransferase